MLEAYRNGTYLDGTPRATVVAVEPLRGAVTFAPQYYGQLYNSISISSNASTISSNNWQLYNTASSSWTTYTSNSTGWYYPSIRQNMYTLADAQRDMGERQLLNYLEQQVRQERAAQSAERVRRSALVDGAQRRSRELLFSCLTEEQRKSVESPRKCFRVVSDMGGIFEIEYGRMHNVFALDHNGARVEEWCVTPLGDFPIWDVMLAQKLALETDSVALADRANIRDLKTGRMVRHAAVQYRYSQPEYLLAAE